MFDPLVFGYVATALNVVGNELLVRRNLLGWRVRLLVNILYIPYAWQIELGGPVLVNHCIFAALNIRGLIVWWQTRKGVRR